MKQKLHTGAWFALVALILLMIWAGVSSPFFAPTSASAQGAYDFSVTSYLVEMDVHTDRTIDVKETIRVEFSGYDSHGIIRDFATDGGVKYSNLSATCDSSDFDPYFETEDGFLSYYLRGDQRVTGQTRTYTIAYTLTVPALSQEGYLPIDVIGYGWQSVLNNVRAVVKLPTDGVSYQVYSGVAGTTGSGNTVTTLSDDGKTITVTAQSLASGHGITLDLSFGEGVLTTKFDPALMIIAIVAVVAIVVCCLLRAALCRQPVLVQTVNLTAPEGMDPLRMGRLIDNSVDTEDLGALVFWAASEGYLTIDMSENQDDPTLIRTQKPIPPSLPSHIQTFLGGLFSSGVQVRVSSLQNSFYTTVERVKTLVSVADRGFFSAKGRWMTVICAIMALILPACAMIMSYQRLAVGMFEALVTAFAAFVFPAALGRMLSYRRHKMKGSAFVAAWIGLLILGIAASFICLLFISPALSNWVFVLSTMGCAILGCLAGTCIVRSKSYNEKLGHILGFKQFITMTEKDRISFMLQDDPELYYRILPYAQVLGVTNEWTDKFKDLNMPAPSYMRGSLADDVVSVVLWSHMFRSLNASMSRTMISRPSQSGSGSFGGGSGGGFGGGGFGGGGGRGC